MRNIGPFSSYQPSVPVLGDDATEDEKEAAEFLESLLDKGIFFIQTDGQEDWYALQASFQADSVKIAYDDSGRIWQFSDDVSKLWPNGYSVAEVDASAVPADLKPNGKWVYADGVISERVYTATEQVAIAETTRSQLIATARETINEWQTELTLGTITDDEKAQLVEWLAYIKALKAVDTSTAPDITWPDAPASSS